METAKHYLQGDTLSMQLATVSGNKPWIASVYFVVDDALNMYWLSWPERRHSMEIAENEHVAATVAIKTSRPVIGVQIEGDVSVVVNTDIVNDVMELYVAKYNEGQKFYNAFVVGTNKHQMYCLKPRTVQLFDEVTYPSQSPLKLL